MTLPRHKEALQINFLKFLTSDEQPGKIQTWRIPNIQPIWFQQRQLPWQLQAWRSVGGKGKNMAQFQSFTNNVTVNGQTVLAVVEGMEHSREKAQQILTKHGIANPHKEEWYPQQSWLNSFKEIAENIGTYALYCIGVKIPDNAQFPPDIDSLEKALKSIDVAYHMNHRGGEIGDYKFLKDADGSLHFICNNPYPCEFDRGIIEGVARKYTTPGQHILVKHDDTAPCRDKGADSCTYHIDIVPRTEGA